MGIVRILHRIDVGPVESFEDLSANLGRQLQICRLSHECGIAGDVGP
jgi:hypothetical protein